MICLCENLELRGLPHHSSDVFLHTDSIFSYFRAVCELLGLIWMAPSRQTSKGFPRSHCKINRNQQRTTEIKGIQWNLMKSDEILENAKSCGEGVITLTHSRCCTECSNTRISIGNGSSRKNTLNLCCGSPRSSEYSLRQIIWKILVVCKKKYNEKKY